MALIQRRRQFISDSVIANFPTAIYFLKHNDVYSSLSAHDRERALLKYKQEQDDQSKQTVTAIIQPPPQRGRQGRGRGRRRNPTYQPQYHYHPSQQGSYYQLDYQPAQRGRGRGGRARGRGHQQQTPFMSPQHTRSYSRYGSDSHQIGQIVVLVAQTQEWT